MVGIAGRSKGCGTCRKRKIKCDEAKPVCKRCEHSRVQCDRYDRFPVFIDRSQTGYRKRKALEEVKPYNPRLQRIYSPEMESIRLISWFRDSQVRSQAAPLALHTQRHWLILVGGRQQPHPALEAALLAMSFVKWSRIECNPDLRQKGRSYYQQSLGLTQKALLCKEDALIDDILATTCVMTLYELSDPSCQRSDSWLDHATGTGNLLCLRGPKNFTSPESRAILEHMRCVFMMRCLALRKSCIFGSHRWRRLPWYGVTKSIEQQVFDQGLRLTSLWEDCDLILLTNEECSASDFDALLLICVDISQTLEFLIAQINFDIAKLTDAGGAANTEASILVITALGIQIGAAASACKLLDASSDTAVSDLHAATSETESETVIKARILCRAHEHLAQRILLSVENRMKAKAGALDKWRMSWSLRLAREQLTPEDPEAKRCEEMLTLLTQCSSPFDALGLPLGRHASSPVYCST